MGEGNRYSELEIASMPIAKIYARAYIELVKEEGIDFELVRSELKFLEELVREREFQGFITSPLITTDMKAKILKLILRNLSKPTLNLLLLLNSKGRLPILKQILQLILEGLDELEGKLKLTLYTPYEIDFFKLRNWELKLSEILGKDVQLKVVIEPELIGGGVLAFDGKALDFSLKRKLDALLSTLQADESWISFSN